MGLIRSRDNARVKVWSRLVDDAKERRSRGRTLVEGVHLVETLLDRGIRPASLILSESASLRPELRALAQRAGVEPVCLADAVFRKISDTQAPVGIAAEIALPADPIDPAASSGCVFLDGVQDAGNVGAILRTAAAFGVPDVLLGPGCADPWSPKALRAAMGGHFFLRLASNVDLVLALKAFGRQSVCMVAGEGVPLRAVDLRGRIGWIFGGEGAGVSDALAAQAGCRATIAMPGGTESLNVAACAAICLYERDRQINTRGVRS